MLHITLQVGIPSFPSEQVITPLLGSVSDGHNTNKLHISHISLSKVKYLYYISVHIKYDSTMEFV